jgi:hypothetical protein
MMNNHKDETSDLIGQNSHREASHGEERKPAQEPALGDLEPRADIKGGTLPGNYNATDVTLKRGIIG